MWSSVRTIPTNEVITAPTDEPVSIEDVKANAPIIDSDDNDAFIRTQLIPTARDLVERLACRSLMTQTRRQYYNSMPCPPIHLRYGPVIAITTFTYLDSNGTSQTLATTEYDYETHRATGHIQEAYGKTWPSAREQLNSVAITYTAGYGATVGKVPRIYRRAIILLCTHWYFNRDELGCAEGDLLCRLERLLAIEGRTVEYA